MGMIKKNWFAWVSPDIFLLIAMQQLQCGDCDDDHLLIPTLFQNLFSSGNILQVLEIVLQGQLL